MNDQRTKFSLARLFVSVTIFGVFAGVTRFFFEMYRSAQTFLEEFTFSVGIFNFAACTILFSISCLFLPESQSKRYTFVIHQMLTVVILFGVSLAFWLLVLAFVGLLDAYGYS